MNRCPDCNKRLRKDAESCPRCGWKKKRFGFGIFSSLTRKNTNSSDFDEEAYLRYMHTEDRVSMGLCFLSMLIPLFGIIYWISSVGERPKRAFACLFAPLFMPFVLVGVLLFALLIMGVIGLIGYMIFA